MGNEPTLEEKLLGEYLRHQLAHAQEAASGRGRRGCQFCPTLKVRPDRPGRGFWDEGLFPQRFLRDLTRDLNKISRMALNGHQEAGRFMERLDKALTSKPWDKPPSSPGALLTTGGDQEGIAQEQVA